MASDKKVVLIGLDICDPYGGAFRVTKTISTKYPDRAINAPMSEGALTGITTGLALAGYKPILEIMFGDFMTLCTDQIVNHASKFKFLFSKDLHMVIRTPMGGYRGYGATHSQSLEKLFFGIPDIRVVAPNIFTDPGELLEACLDYGNPVIFIENKLDYYWQLIEMEKQKIDRKGIIITYGGMTTMAMEIAKECDLNIMAITSISPISESFLDYIKPLDNVYVLEEGIIEGGFGSEVARLLLENKLLPRRFKVFGAKNKVIGCAKEIEEYVLPNKERIIEEIKCKI